MYAYINILWKGYILKKCHVKLGNNLKKFGSHWPLTWNTFSYDTFSSLQKCIINISKWNVDASSFHNMMLYDPFFVSEKHSCLVVQSFRAFGYVVQSKYRFSTAINDFRFACTTVVFFRIFLFHFIWKEHVFASYLLKC